MDSLQKTKIVTAIIPASPNNTDATAISVDTKGYREAMFILSLGAHATGSPDTCCLVQGDTSALADAATSADAITGTDLSGATWVTAQNQIVWNVNLRKRKRFIRMLVTPQAASVLSGVCILGKPEVAPTTGAQRILINATTTGGATELAVI